MNSTINASTIPSKSNNWGFKSQIQFFVAQEVAGRFGHAWATVRREVEVRTPTASGAMKIQMKRFMASSPAEAARWVEEDNLAQPSHAIGQAYGVPTPRWESGSGTFKINVTPTGVYDIIYNKIIQETFTPNGVTVSASTVPGWHTVNFKWDWEAPTHNGRGQTLQESVRLAIRRGGYDENPDPILIEAFEADKNFWRTGFLAGTRWYE
jgi:hypothetical protein